MTSNPPLPLPGGDLAKPERTRYSVPSWEGRRGGFIRKHISYIFGQEFIPASGM